MNKRRRYLAKRRRAKAQRTRRGLGISIRYIKHFDIISATRVRFWPLPEMYETTLRTTTQADVDRSLQQIKDGTAPVLLLPDTDRRGR